MRNPFKRLFQRKPKPLLLDNTFRLVPAFELKGETYYMHEDPLSTATGRGLHAMGFMEQLMMRCSINYLNLHTSATDKALDGKRPNVGAAYQLNSHLKERAALLAALPEHVYKMASICFFTASESPFRYDEAVGNKKVIEWSKADGMHDFFLQTPLKILVPSLASAENSSKDYLRAMNRINQFHLKYLYEYLGKKPPTIDI